MRVRVWRVCSPFASLTAVCISTLTSFPMAQAVGRTGVVTPVLLIAHGLRVLCSGAPGGQLKARLAKPHRALGRPVRQPVDRPAAAVVRRPTHASALCAFLANAPMRQAAVEQRYPRAAYGWERPVASRSVSARIDSHCVRPHARARTHLVCIVSTRKDMTMCDRDDCLFRLVDAREPVQPRR
jgi:hypothetical protein